MSGPAAGDEAGDNDEDLLERLFRERPPHTREALDHLARHIEAQWEVEEHYDDDPLAATQGALRAVMLLHSAGAPPGSPGPSRALIALLQAVIEASRGEPPSLLGHAPTRHPHRHPSPLDIIAGRALAAVSGDRVNPSTGDIRNPAPC